MNSEIVTVDYLLDLFQKLSNAGYGDLKIKCQDGFLHEDEIGVNYLKKEVVLRGFIFNADITKRVTDFKNAIQKAYEKFYETER